MDLKKEMKDIHILLLVLVVSTVEGDMQMTKIVFVCKYI